LASGKENIVTTKERISHFVLLIDLRLYTTENENHESFQSWIQYVALGKDSVGDYAMLRGCGARASYL